MAFILSSVWMTGYETWLGRSRMELLNSGSVSSHVEELKTIAAVIHFVWKDTHWDWYLANLVEHPEEFPKQILEGILDAVYRQIASSWVEPHEKKIYGNLQEQLLEVSWRNPQKKPG